MNSGQTLRSKTGEEAKLILGDVLLNVAEPCLNKKQPEMLITSILFKLPPGLFQMERDFTAAGLSKLSSTRFPN